MTAASAPENLRGMVTTAELDLVDKSQPSDPGEESDSGIERVRAMSDARQQTAAVQPRPQLKLMNPERPLRYIPIHVWYVCCPFEAKAVQGIQGSFFSFLIPGLSI